MASMGEKLPLEFGVLAQTDWRCLCPRTQFIMIDSNNKLNYVIATTDDYERLVPFFVANDLESPR